MPDEHTEQSTHETNPAKLDHWSPVTEAMRIKGDPRVTKRGNPIDPPDPGTPMSRLLAILGTILVVGFVVLWQNTPDDTKQRLLLPNQPAAPAIAVAADRPAPGNFGQVDLMGRIFLRGLEVFRSPSQNDAADTSNSGKTSSQSPMTQNIMAQIDSPKMSYSDEDRVRLVMLYAEFEGTEIALKKLEELRLDMLNLNQRQDQDEAQAAEKSSIEISSEDLVLHEINILQTLYTQGQDQLTEDETMQLAERYRYIGRVALTHGLPDNDPMRHELITGIWSLAAFFGIVALIVVIAPLVGLVLLILGLISFFNGRMPMRARIPTPGGSVYLETYAIFVPGFCVMAVTTFFVGNSKYAEFAAFSLLVQWLLLLTVFWGLIRGADAKDWRLAIGWHTGEGLFKEIGCGILGYLASLPVYIVGVVITAILLLAREKYFPSSSGEAEPMVNPIFEMIAGGDFFMILLLFVLATTWAPIVEESIFRGALYRHLRGRLHWVLAALGTGVLFAFMHDYGPLMVAPLIALGFMFAFMREWRGSIIAPMTAHFIHNFTLISGMIIFVQLIKDPM